MSAIDELGMKQAIAIARQGIASGQSPFGSVIMKGDKTISATHNRVWKETDPTAHAEVNNIRDACRTLKTVDLSGYTLYTTCEPCPMCLSAIHWAKLDRVVYGATIADAAGAGFQELEFPAKELARQGKSSLVVEEGPLRETCAGLFKEWKDAGLAKPY